MGRATALAFARYGVRGLVVADLNEAGAEVTAREAKEIATNPEFAVLAAGVDVREWVSVLTLFEGAVKKFGRIDYSVTTAGVSIVLCFFL